MNPELPPNPRAELEARVTAFLLGELPAHEAAAFRQQMDDDAQLAELCEHLKPAIKLLRESAANPETPAATETAPLKLSDERRQKLLAHFKTIAPKEFVPALGTKKYLLFGKYSRLVELAACLVFLLIIAGIVMPKFSGVSKTAKSHVVQVDALSQNDIAKFAADAATDQAKAGVAAKMFASQDKSKLTLALSPQPHLDGDNRASISGQAAADAEATRRNGKGQAEVSRKNLGGTYTFYRDLNATPPSPAPPSSSAQQLTIVLPPANQSADASSSVADNQQQGVGFSADQPVVNGGAGGGGAGGFQFGRVSKDSTDQQKIPIQYALSAKVQNGLSTLGVTPSDNLTTYNFAVPPSPASNQGIELSHDFANNQAQSANNNSTLTVTPPPPFSSGVPVAASTPPPSVANEGLTAGTVTTESGRLGGKADGFNLNAVELTLEKPLVQPPAPAPVASAAPAGIYLGEVNGQASAAPVATTAAPAEKAPMLGALFPSRNRTLRSPHDAEASGGVIQSLAPSKPQMMTPLAGERSQIKQSEDIQLAQNQQAPPSEVAKQTDDTNVYKLNVVGYVNTTIPVKELNVVPLESAPPQSSAGLPPGMPLNKDQLNAVQPGHATFSTDSDTHSLAIVADKSGVNQVDVLPSGKEAADLVVGEMKKKSVNDSGEMKVFHLKNADPAEVAKLLPELFPKDGPAFGSPFGGFGGSQTRNSSVLAVPDPRTGSIVVTADPKTMESISRLVADVDVPVTPTPGGNVGGVAATPLQDRSKALVQQQIPPGMTGVIQQQNAAPSVGYGVTSLSPQDDAGLRKPAAPAPEPQPEVLTSENALSTFSLNVSDVSFKLAAASLEKGVLPEPASIRSEEFINAFDYRDPEPAPGAPIGFAWERARDPFAQNRDLVRFSVKTAAAGREPGRPLNIVLLLDNSGSMERADRVQIIHEALRVLAGELQPQDKLSVVIFARTASLWVDGLSGDKAGAVADSVDRLTPQGGTNLEEAMRLAYETARRHYLANGVNRVVLLTDGAANLGNVDPAALQLRVEENRKQGIALDCFGIGWEGYNDDLLEVLTRHGDGRYGFLNTPADAATDFAGQLAGALHVAAADVKVQVEFNPARVTAYRQIGYAKHQLTAEQFRDNTVAAAQIGAAESGNALYVVAVNPAGSGPLGVVRVRFKVPGTSEVQEHAWELSYTGNAVPLDQANPAMRLAATASGFAEWLSQIPYAAEITPDELLHYLNGVPQVYGADTRPQKLEWMIRQAKSLSGK